MEQWQQWRQDKLELVKGYPPTDILRIHWVHRIGMCNPHKRPQFLAWQQISHWTIWDYQRIFSACMEDVCERLPSGNLSLCFKEYYIILPMLNGLFSATNGPWKHLCWISRTASGQTTYLLVISIAATSPPKGCTVLSVGDFCHWIVASVETSATPCLMVSATFRVPATHQVIHADSEYVDLLVTSLESENMSSLASTSYAGMAIWSIRVST